MRRILTIILSVFLLTACASGNNAVQPKQNNNSNNLSGNNNHQSGEIETNNDETSTNDDSPSFNNNEPSNNDENVTNSKVNNDHLKQFTEFNQLAQTLDLDLYEGTVQTDNKGNRIILFRTADGKNEYKSIFIKNKQYLKVVQFNNENNLLYKGVIK